MSKLTALRLFGIAGVLGTFVVIGWCISGKFAPAKKPLVIQENKPIKSKAAESLAYFDSLSDSMHANMFKALDFVAKGNIDSSIYYSGKAHAYLEMEKVVK